MALLLQSTKELRNKLWVSSDETKVLGRLQRRAKAGNMSGHRKKGQELGQKNIKRNHQKCRRQSALKPVRSSRHYPPNVATRT